MLEAEAKECRPSLGALGALGELKPNNEGVVTMAQKKAKKKTVGKRIVKRTEPVRNTAIPKMPTQARSNQGQQARQGQQTQASKHVSHEAVAKRAYEIFQSGKGGTQHENWLRAERELRGS
jgi:hypothetical protein